MSRADNKVPRAPSGVAAVPSQAFDLTPDELVWAKRIFSALRGMEPNYREDALRTYTRAIELTAASHPLHQTPALRIVKRGQQ